MSARRATWSSSRLASRPRPQLWGGSPIRQLMQYRVLKTTSTCVLRSSCVKAPTSRMGQCCRVGGVGCSPPFGAVVDASPQGGDLDMDTGLPEVMSRRRQRQAFFCARVAMAMTTSEST
eukprot:CAMPEP_0198700744 /NCGR_PEP_ID=MMETSP1468-20131203/374359_1 /TAXON_ID=1461545 /ORGANISM="Mantoniella sp, Strain CCMP1436" /LENGTH=118 /DNA_ID=CAMNT_0044458795 /DNA_START=121 /DNA_END=477 /DNA_ORIENTATION=+